MGILTDIDKTITDTDIFLIKEKLFGRIYDRSWAINFTSTTMYAIIHTYEISINDIEKLIEAGVCSTYGCATRPSIFEWPLLADHKNKILISDFEFCKKFIKDPDSYFKFYGIDDQLSYYNVNKEKRSIIDQDALSCIVVFNSDFQCEYLKYKDKQTYIDLTKYKDKYGYYGAGAMYSIY